MYDFDCGGGQETGKREGDKRTRVEELMIESQIAAEKEQKEAMEKAGENTENIGRMLAEEGAGTPWTNGHIRWYKI